MSETRGLRSGREGTARAPRSIYLDALRAVALARVVTYHVVGADWLTAFTAMPLMFFIAGSLYAGSLERRAARSVIGDRYRRILVPYWGYIAAMIALWAALGVLSELDAWNWVGLVFPVLSPNGPQGPGAGTELEITWIALWYLQFHLILSLVGPLLRRAQLRRPRLTWGVLIVLFVGSLAAGAGLVVVVFYVGCWILGYHQHDGQLRAWTERRWPVVCAATGPIGLALFLAFEPSSSWSLNAARAAVTGASLLGAFWLTAALGLQSRVEPWLAGRRTRSVVHWVSQRSLSIYMWHMAAIYAAVTLDLPGSETWPGLLLWCIALTFVVVVATGWTEDIAARRRPTFWPRPPVDVHRAPPAT